MGIVDALVENALDFLDKERGVDAWMPDEEKCVETEEQQLQRRAEIQQAFEDLRRQERIIARRT